MGDMIIDVPKYSDIIGCFIAELIECKAINFKDVLEVSDVIENRSQYGPVFISSIISEYLSSYPESKLQDDWKSSNVKPTDFFEGDYKDILINDIKDKIVDSSISSVWPLADIAKYLKNNLDNKKPEDIVKYIESHNNKNILKSSSFIEVLIGRCIKYVTTKTIFQNQFRPREHSRELYKEKEEIITHIKPLITHFINNSNSVDVIYSIQDYCLDTKYRIGKKERKNIYYYYYLNINFIISL